MARKLRLRQAGRAALDLQSFWIERLEYEEEDEVPDDPPATTVRVSRPEILDAGDGKYLVTLRLKVAQGEARSLDLTVAGAFLLPPDAEGQPSHLGMLLYNGSAILFSAARGIVESVTGVSGLGRMHVPSVNLAEVLEH